MAELAAAEGAAGLASSIITFIGFSIEFGKLVREVARSQGEFPTELRDCHEYIEIVATWLGDVNWSLPPNRTATEEDQPLEEAVRRCTQTSNELAVLLRTLSNDVVRDSHASLGQGTRATFGTLKRAAKIMWKRDQIAEFRRKLRENRDDVQAHLASRICSQVKRILYV
jgi:hypothetical protein